MLPPQQIYKLSYLNKLTRLLYEKRNYDKGSASLLQQIAHEKYMNNSFWPPKMRV